MSMQVSSPNSSDIYESSLDGMNNTNNNLNNSNNNLVTNLSAPIPLSNENITTPPPPPPSTTPTSAQVLMNNNTTNNNDTLTSSSSSLTTTTQTSSNNTNMTSSNATNITTTTSTTTTTNIASSTSEIKDKLKQEKKEKHSAKKLMKELAVCKIILEEMEVGYIFFFSKYYFWRVIFPLFLFFQLHEDAWPFLLPVNTKQFPTYKKIIKMPMDFSTIKKRLQDLV